MLFTGKVNNEAYRYDGYKDLNDYLRGKRRWTWPACQNL